MYIKPFLVRINRQNLGINTKIWQVLRVDMDKIGDQIFIYLVDEASCDQIQNRKLF